MEEALQSNVMTWQLFDCRAVDHGRGIQAVRRRNRLTATAGPRPISQSELLEPHSIDPDDRRIQITEEKAYSEVVKID